MKTSLLLLTSVLALGMGTAASAQGPRGDARGDASVTRAELTQRLDARFARLDGDGDGRITQAEMAAAKAQRQAKRAEWQAAHPERAANREARMEKRQSRMAARGGERPTRDTNGDGVITRDEFGTRALERFARMDTNSDGTVTREERQAARQARRAARG